MVWIDGLIKILGMACLTLRGGPFKCSIGMTQETIGCSVGSGQWKGCGVVVKSTFCLTCGVAGQACRAVIDISRYAGMLFVCFRVGVTGDTGKLTKISGRCMTIYTIAPFPFVRSAINRKILSVMIKRSGRPGILVVTHCTFSRKAKRGV